MNTPEFKKVSRFQYGRGTDFKQDNVEYTGNNCNHNTAGNCLLKCINQLTGKDYMNDFLNFIRDEQRRSNAMIFARIQPFCKKQNINIGCCNGFRVCPRTITERNIALYVNKNHFCSIWKSNALTFNKAKDELRLNSKDIVNIISDRHFKSFIKDEYKPRKIQSQLTNMIVYDTETFNTDRAVSYSFCIYKLSRISSKYTRDTGQQKYENCRKDCFVLKGTDCINDMLYNTLEFKGEAERVKNKIGNFNYYLLAQKGSCFDGYVVINNLHQWRTIVSLIKNGSGIVSLKKFNG